MLQGLKVLDVSRLLPGPYATMVMADLGAQVDKLEDPEGGDMTRHMPPMKGDVSALFLALNRNKRSVTLNLKSAAGVEALKKMVQHYDVLVESFRPGVMQKLGISAEVLMALNPRLIVCSISGYGQTGPDRLKAGHDIDYIARSGVLGYSGPANGSHALPGAQIADIGGGLFGIIGILSAVIERQATGKGRHIDVSMTEAAMAFIHMHLGARLQLGSEGAPLSAGREPLNGGYACYGVYKTSDNQSLAVGALEPKFSLAMLEALGRADLSAAVYDTGDEGLRARAQLEKIFAAQSASHWQAFFSKLDVCVEVVSAGDAVLADPQLRARGVFSERGGVTHLKTPLVAADFPVSQAPRLGEHTETILKECGVSAPGDQR